MDGVTCDTRLYMRVSNKIRSHARAVTDWIFVPELTASPRPQATGWQSVPGRKSNQLLHGRDFLILFHQPDGSKCCFPLKLLRSISKKSAAVRGSAAAADTAAVFMHLSVIRPPPPTRRHGHAQCADERTRS